MQHSLLGQMMAGEITARAARPPDNPFEEGRLAVLLDFFYRVGPENFTPEVQEQAARFSHTKDGKLPTQFQSRDELVKWRCSKLADYRRRPEPGLYEQGYLHALLGIADYTAREEDPAECLDLARQLMTTPQILQLDRHFDFETHTFRRG